VAPTDRFKKIGFEMLGAADGLAQFYDRDSSPEMAKVGMEGFQEFMVKPERIADIRERLDAERKANMK
ncbi:MAG: carbohydrate ABC transporter substrate-binding protein, partial [Spirochaetes bacterium]